MIQADWNSKRAVAGSLIPANDVKPDPRRYAGQPIADLNSCGSCGAWWGSSDPGAPATDLIFRFAEPNSTRYLWVDYRGWLRKDDAGRCPACGTAAGQPEISLRFDGEGQVQWPDGQEPGQEAPVEGGANPFATYVAGSKNMAENISFLEAKEVQHKKDAWGYTAEIEDIRDTMDEMRVAFKEVVYRFAAILPPGWRVVGDYDKWLKGVACAGFVHGEMDPDMSLMIGGQCRTVAEIEMKLDRLHSYVCDIQP